MTVSSLSVLPTKACRRRETRQCLCQATGARQRGIFGASRPGAGPIARSLRATCPHGPGRLRALVVQPAQRRASILEDAHIERPGVCQGLELARHAERDGLRRDHRELLLPILFAFRSISAIISRSSAIVGVEVAAEKSQSVFSPGRKSG